MRASSAIGAASAVPGRHDRMSYPSIDVIENTHDPPEPVAAGHPGAELDLPAAGVEAAIRCRLPRELALQQRHFTVRHGDHQFGASLFGFLSKPLHDLAVTRELQLFFRRLLRAGRLGPLGARQLEAPQSHNLLLDIVGHASSVSRCRILCRHVYTPTPTPLQPMQSGGINGQKVVDPCRWRPEGWISGRRAPGLARRSRTHLRPCRRRERRMSESRDVPARG